jgi:hypothetical protein
MEAEHRCPIAEQFLFPAKGNPPILSRIPGLLLASRPAHVAGLIVAVVVNALQGVLWRGPRAYFGKERCERIPPALADANAAPAIVFEPRRGRVFATSLHGKPALILSADSQLTAAPLAVSRHLAPLTARFGGPVPEVDPGNGGGLAALAPADPSQLALLSFGRKTDDGQLAVDVARFVYGAMRRRNRIGFSHDANLPEGWPIGQGRQAASSHLTARFILRQQAGGGN